LVAIKRSTGRQQQSPPAPVKSNVLFLFDVHTMPRLLADKSIKACICQAFSVGFKKYLDRIGV
jgi:hypothetical protein